MSERRTAPRTLLAVPAVIYTGQSETRCRTRDLSRRGVAVTSLSEELPNRMLRIRFSLTEEGPSVLCDCFPVHDSTSGGQAWGLSFLDPDRDLPPSLEDLLRALAAKGQAQPSPPLRFRGPRDASGPAPETSQGRPGGAQDSDGDDPDSLPPQLQALLDEPLDCGE